MAAARELGFPVALKTLDPRFARAPTSAPCASTSRTSARCRRRTCRWWPRSTPTRCATLVVQRMAALASRASWASAEDPLFGPSSPSASPGRAELLGDRGYRIPPLTDQDARPHPYAGRLAAAARLRRHPTGRHRRPRGPPRPGRPSPTTSARVVADLPPRARRRLTQAASSSLPGSSRRETRAYGAPPPSRRQMGHRDCGVFGRGISDGIPGCAGLRPTFGKRGLRQRVMALQARPSAVDDVGLRARRRSLGALSRLRFRGSPARGPGRRASGYCTSRRASRSSGGASSRSLWAGGIPGFGRGSRARSGRLRSQ